PSCMMATAQYTPSACTLCYHLPALPPRSPLAPYTTLFLSGFCENGAAVTITGIDHVVSTLRWGVFNNVLWPDFSKIPHAACSRRDRKSTRLNSSHGSVSYATICLKTIKHADVRTTVNEKTN